ncbi:hypothetical protein P9112_005272 [Eukaryota sp. TZLM1-RC]
MESQQGQVPNMTEKLEEVLTELCVKAIENVDDATKSDPVGLLKLVEKCHWDYIDNYQPKNKGLPQLKKFFRFAKALHTVSPTMQQTITDWDSATDMWIKFKRNCPRVKLILLNEDRTRFLMVKTGSGSIDFPGGKINENQCPMETIIREAQEELGVDVSPYLSQERSRKFMNGYHFIGVDFPESTKLAPETKGEISGYQWIEVSNLDDLCKKNNFQAPLYKYLRKFLREQNLHNPCVEDSQICQKDLDSLIDRIRLYQIDVQNATSLFKQLLSN